ncbi:hypothetical protein BSKO_02543 [Bryopsis sp. KO-2023]|nr:hypothetical protein BSKO_02543 [Bryopsis sp. KO-2023]
MEEKYQPYTPSLIVFVTRDDGLYFGKYYGDMAHSKLLEIDSCILALRMETKSIGVDNCKPTTNPSTATMVEYLQRVKEAIERIETGTAQAKEAARALTELLAEEDSVISYY